jgi:aspartate kinase
MKIFKFGGASVKDANGVKNVAHIISDYGDGEVLVVISAMGKTTNALEKVVDACFHGKKELKDHIEEIRSYHQSITNELFPQNGEIWLNEVENLFLELECLVDNENLQDDYDFLYDQIVTFGELISTRIVSAYLLSQNTRNQWLDARNFILTDSRYRDANVQWDETNRVVQNRLKPLSSRNLIITQGFMGKGFKGETTTLGREGSDYTAAIFGKLLQAESVTIWKDVAGVMNADPKKFPDSQLISELTYNDAIELAYYGASVIHPKTIQPLKHAGIPLYVKSFIHPDENGTKVSENGTPIQIPCRILKENQILLEISTRDFNFIAEESLQRIFAALSNHKVRVNIMQNSAIHFRCVFDNKENKFVPLMAELDSLGFNAKATENLQLLSIYQPENTTTLGVEGQIILEQNSGSAKHYLLQF